VAGFTTQQYLEFQRQHGADIEAIEDDFEVKAFDSHTAGRGFHSSTYQLIPSRFCH
jgi:hypothetical protein